MCDAWLGRKDMTRLRPFKQEQTGSRTVVCIKKRHSDATRAWNDRRLVHRQWTDVHLVDIERPSNQVRRRLAAVDGPVSPGRCESTVVIGMEMTEKVGLAPLDLAEAERIDTDGHARQDLVEWRCASLRP